MMILQRHSTMAVDYSIKELILMTNFTLKISKDAIIR